MCLHKDNRENLEEMIQLALELGADRFVHYNFVPAGRGWEMLEEDLNPQEREKVLPIATQAFRQSPGVGILMFFAGHFTDTMVQPVDPALIPLRHKVRTLPQTDAITQQPTQFLGEGLPFSRIVVLIDFFQFAQQVHQAALTLGGADAIVRSPKIRNQNSIE